MPDISMGTNRTCSKRAECYRFRAVPNGRQSYTSFEETDRGYGCESFKDIWPGSLVRPLEEES